MHSSSKRVVIAGFAKINLFLDVICKRPDGYHNIETVFQSIDLHDTLAVELTSSEIQIACTNSSVPLDESNLAWRAFDRLAKVTGYQGGIMINIEKRIPPQSGLGGGSSNAAATLVALNHLLEAGLTSDELRIIGRELGADVPFFISGGLAAAWQIGDCLEPLRPFAKTFLVVAVPADVAVSTPKAYGMLSAPEWEDPMPTTFGQCTTKLKNCVKALNSGVPLGENYAIDSVLHNALEAPVILEYPRIGELKERLLEAGARGAQMTGSGSAVFGLADSLGRAEQIKENLERSMTCDCFVAGTIDRGWKWLEGGIPG